MSTPNVYAKGTTVPVEKSEQEIRAMLIKCGADQFASGWDQQSNQAAISFRIENRHVKIIIPLPSWYDQNISHVNRGAAGGWTERTKDDQQKRFDQAMRERWRALVLVIKAKLEAVELGISTIEREFLADVVIKTPQGASTMYEVYAPQIEAMYSKGIMPSPLAGLLGPGGND